MCTKENNNLTNLAEIYKHLSKASKELAESQAIKNLTDPNSEINIKLREFTNSAQESMQSIYSMLTPIIDNAKQFQDEILKSYQQIDFKELSNKLNDIYTSTYSYDLGETFYDDVNKCINSFNNNPENYDISDYEKTEETIKELVKGKHSDNTEHINTIRNTEYCNNLAKVTFVIIVFSIFYFMILNPSMFNLSQENITNLINLISTIINFLSLFK